MAFEGRLEDFSVVDVLQMLHLSKRDGRLVIHGQTGQAVMTLKGGYIISANHPVESLTVGRMLLDAGAVDPDSITHVLELQGQQGDAHKPLVAVLIDEGRIDEETGRQALTRLIEETLVEVVSWKKGAFTFEPGEVEAHDDFQHFPKHLNHSGVDIQHALMDAMQLLDERSQESERRTAPPSAAPADARPSSDRPSAPPSPEEEEELRRTPIASLLDVPVLDGAVSFDEEVDLRPSAPLGRKEPAAPASEQRSPAADPDTREVPVIVPTMATKAPLPSFAEPTFDEPAAVEAGGGELGQAALDEALEALDFSEDSLDLVLGVGYLERKLVAFSQDSVLKTGLFAAGQEVGIDVTLTAFEPEIAEKLQVFARQGASPVMVVDVQGRTQDNRWLQRSLSLIRRISLTNPEVSVVVVGGRESFFHEDLLRLGVRTILPRPALSDDRADYGLRAEKLAGQIIAAVDACFDGRRRQMLRLRQVREQLTVLLRRAHEIGEAREPTEVALVVLRFLADFVDRALVFLVEEGQLVGLGSFGVGGNGEDAASVARAMQIAIEAGSLVEEVVTRGEVFFGWCEDRFVIDQLLGHLGKPKPANVVLLPLRSSGQTRSLVLGDFGKRLPTSLEQETLELLALQAQLRLELEERAQRAGGE